MTTDPDSSAARFSTFPPSPNGWASANGTSGRLVHERRIPFVKWGHLLRFEPAAIEAWLDENRRAAGAVPSASSSHR